MNSGRISRRAAFVFNTGGSTASSSGITGKFDNSAHVKAVYSDERLGACVIKPCHDRIALFSVCESKQ